MNTSAVRKSLAALVAAGVLVALPGARAHAHGCCGGLVSQAAMSPAWLMMMQAQLAQAQLAQSQLLQAQLSQAALAQQQLRVAPNAALVPPPQAPALKPPVPARFRKAPAPKAPARVPVEVRAVDHGAAADGLAADLVFAPADEQERLLEKLRDGPGAAYTEALAGTIPKLDGEVRDRARAALAGRLARMTAGTLRLKLQADDFETCRAAALACAMKEETDLVPDLIARLEQDPESPLVPALRAALTSLTERDFGPTARSSRADRTRAVAAWKQWWQARASR